MVESKLQKGCAKHLISEGIYYRKTANGLLACVRGHFVVFEFEEADSPRKLTASGGLIYRPRSLQEFVRTIRDIVEGKGGNIVSYRKVGCAEQVGYIIKFKLRQVGKRFKLWFTRDKKCHSCCLFCKYANTCMDELL